MKLIYSHTESVAETLRDISRRYKHRKKFLDIGCGTGFRTSLFNAYGRDVTGMDLRDYRESEYKKFKFIHGDFFKNTFPNESFDMIHSFDVIEHLEDQESILRESYRLLKPGGIKVISTPNRYRIMNAILLLLQKRTYPYCISQDHDEYPEYWHITEFSAQKLKKIFEKTGFEIVEHHKIFYGLPLRRGFRTLFGLPFYHNHIHVIKKIM